ncbi:hypothetical protein RSOLAG22IIIB_14223 [Rhizoctonia solani]|uniref:Cyanovirin-N domain-containing protein n=1 Tax=Rhizoctonia solani TaxID=456999 RepID=A0A0K6FX21_9AGAM|nr:hypothetical protein RSOLAG22IIIB_14223 [Rhizoctonia solani]
MRLTTIFALVGTFMLSATGVVAGGGFSASCSGYYIRDNHFLVANCADGNGGRRDSTLDLNQCIVNAGGRLICQANGGYGASCSGCGIRTGAYMTCECNGTGATIVDLDQCVANYGETSNIRYFRVEQ